MIYNIAFWIQVASAIWVGVSAPIYIFLIATLVVFWKKEQHFQTSFYCLWISLGFSDLIHAPLFWISSKIPLMGILTEVYLNAGEGRAKLWMYVTSVTHYAQVLGIALLSLNRFTALLIPTKSEKMWMNKGVMPVLIVSVWILAFLIGIPELYMEMNWVITEDNTTKVAFHFMTRDLAVSYFFWIGIVLDVTAILIVSMYAYMFYMVGIMSSDERKALKIQVKLAVCGFCISVFLCFLSVCMMLFNQQETSVVFDDRAVPFFVSCDLNTFCNAYLLLITSEIARHRAGELFRNVLCRGKAMIKVPGFAVWV